MEILDNIYRSESRRILATLIRLLGDFDQAEEAMHEAFRAALEQWPKSGIPDNPGAWLMAAAKHRAIDRLRRTKLLERKHGELSRELQARQERAVAELETAIDDDIGEPRIAVDLYIGQHDRVLEVRIGVHMHAGK